MQAYFDRTGSNACYFTPNVVLSRILNGVEQRWYSHLASMKLKVGEENTKKQEGKHVLVDIGTSIC